MALIPPVRQPTVDPKERLTRADADELVAYLAPFNRITLLTGAGFSKAWGGFLAAEFWPLVIRDPLIRDRPRIDDLVHEELDFEAALARAEMERRTFDDDDRAALWGAVLRAFEVQDRQMRDASESYSGALRALVEFFISRANHTSCLFTLNQDLAVERFTLTGNAPRIEIPGVLPPGPDWWFGRQSPTAPWVLPSPPSQVAPFTPSSFTTLKGRLLYVKLHGSADWRIGADESLAVLGGLKEATIRRFPILQMNNALFRATLAQAERPRLFVIGYGFGDPHINEVIRDAVVRNELLLWIVDPRTPPNLKGRLKEMKVPEIWRAVAGYSTERFFELFDARSTYWATLTGGDFLR